MGSDRPTWQDYNDAQLDRPVRPLAARLLAQAGEGRGASALDLGCGSGVETRALVAAGWRVTAVDTDPAMPARLRDLVDSGDVTAVVGDVREIDLGRHALVHSSLTLPFVPRAEFAFVWERVRHSLAPGGWLGVDLFGLRDGWSTTPELNFHPRAGIDQLLAGFTDVDVVEEEWDGPAFNAAVKHWHVFRVTARRRADDPAPT